MATREWQRPRNKNRKRVETEDGEKTNRARHIMEEFIGHELPEDQVVHHKNEDEGGDYLPNLEIVKNKDHLQMHQDGIMVSPWKRERLRKMARAMDELDIEFLAEFSGDDVDEVRKLFSHIED